MAYKWIALSNTTLGILLATVNQSIVIISLPAIFRGIGLDPLAPGNTSYLLWMLMGYLLVSAVLVVTLGRLGDMLGRVKIYNLGFVVFTVASILLSAVPFTGSAGAIWLIGFRIVQGIGGAMLMANSTAILTDAFSASERGMALGINQVAALAGSFIGLVAGGLLSEWHWRSVFLVSVPLGILGTVWAYRSLREVVVRRVVSIDWWGNLTFAVGLTAMLAAITYGIQPYGGHTEGWTNPWVLTGLFGGFALLALFVFIESRVRNPMFSLGLFKIRAFATGNIATLLSSIARGGMQFMLIIWLQGIWLPLHGYDFEQTPLWAGIYLLPLTVGFLAAGPLSGRVSDRHGARILSTAGLLLVAVTFLGLLLLPIDFTYWQFAVLIALNGAGSGLFAAPNTASVMSSVPASERGAAAGMGSTFMTAGTVLSIGVFFSLLIAGLANSLPSTLGSGLQAAGVPAEAAQRAAELPAGGQRVRGVPRLQPGAGAARAAGHRPAAGRPGRAHHRPAVLPAADLRPRPLRAGGRVPGRGRAGGGGGGRVGAAREPVCARGGGAGGGGRRGGGRGAGAAGRRRAGGPATVRGCVGVRAAGTLSR